MEERAPAETATIAALMRRVADLNDSRLRLMAEADDVSLRVEEQLHSGIQQRLVTTGMELHLVLSALPADHPIRSPLIEIAEQLDTMALEARDLARQAFPAILTDGGLGPALRSMVRRAPVPVTLDRTPLGRFPPLIEVTAYLVASSVVDAASRAGADHVPLSLAVDGDRLRLTGTVPVDCGNVLTPVVRDRIDALGGTADLRPGVVVVSLPRGLRAEVEDPR